MVADALEALNIKTPESRLLRLPLELREKIYAHLLDTKNARSLLPFAYRPKVRNGKLSVEATSSPFRLCTAKLRVNKQIHLESVPTLYSSNLFVRLSLYNDDIY